MHAVGALIVVGGQLGGRDEVDAVLHRMGVGVPHALDGIVVRDCQMRHSRAGRQKRQLVRRGRAIGKCRMRMQVTGHKRHLTCECGYYGTYYYTTSRGRIASRGGQCSPANPVQPARLPGGYRIRPYAVGIDARHRPWNHAETGTFAGEQCSPLQILRYFRSFLSSSKYFANSSISASVRASVSARAATKLRGLPPNRRCHTLLLSAGRYSFRVRATPF